LQEWLVGKGKQLVTWQTLVEVLKDAKFSELAKDTEVMKCVNDVLHASEKLLYSYNNNNVTFPTSTDPKPSVITQCM